MLDHLWVSPLFIVLHQEVPSKEGEESEPLPISQIKTAEELAAIRDIEKDAKLQQEPNTRNDEVLEWFNDQIVKFGATIQLALRNYAQEFLHAGKIEIKRLPLHDTSYTQLELIMTSSIFILAGKSRVQCADFVLNVFVNYFPERNLSDIQKNKGAKNHVENNEENTIISKRNLF